MRTLLAIYLRRRGPNQDETLSCRTALAVKNVSGLAAGFIPLALGLIAQRLGLQVAMWLLLLGPVALLIGLPRLTTA